MGEEVERHKERRKEVTIRKCKSTGRKKNLRGGGNSGRDHSGKERNKMHCKYGEAAEVSNSHQEA